MNVALWVAQGLLALEFTLVGALHTFQNERLKVVLAKGGVGPRLMAFIGVCELLGAVGVTLPALTHILPWLTPVAASALVVLTVLATTFNIRQRSYPAIALSSFFLVVSAFVAYGRFVLAPIQ